MLPPSTQKVSIQLTGNPPGSDRQPKPSHVGKVAVKSVGDTTT